MPHPQTSDVTEEEFEKFLQEKSQEDGLDTKEEDEPEAEEQETEEDEADGEPEAASEGDEAEEEPAEEAEESEEEPSELNWEAIKDPRFKSEFDRVAAEAERLQKAHAKIQSEWTKASQARREEEGSLKEVRAKAAQADQWNQLLAEHPHLEQVIKRELERARDPMRAVNIPPGLEKDPLFQYMRQTYEPTLRALRAENQALKQKVGVVDQLTAREERVESERKLEAILTDAGTEFKAMFNRDWTQAEKKAVLQYMVEKNYFDDGATVAVRVFRDQYKKTLSQAQAAQAKAKAKKFPARTKAVAPARKSQDAATPEEAIQRALADQGFGI